MTAFDLIDSIFSRVQPGTAGNERMITGEQLKFLRNLIGADPEGGALRRDGAFVEVWAPAGRTKYRIEERPGEKLHKLSRFGNMTASDTGRLF